MWRRSGLVGPFFVAALVRCHGAPTAAGGSAAAPKPAAAAAHDLLGLRKQAGAALEAKDWKAARDRLQEIVDRFGAPPYAVWALGVLETRLGDFDVAMGHFEDYAAMGLARESAATDEALAPLRATPAWTKLEEELASNAARKVENAKLGLRLPDEELIAEDLAWDAKARVFYVSAVRTRAIYAVRFDDGAATRFVQPGQDGLFSVLGLALDGARGKLWASSAALPQANVYDSVDAGKTGVRRYDLATGALDLRIDLPPVQGRDRALADMTLAPNGDAYVADGVGGQMFIAHASTKTLEPLDDGKSLVSPQTPALAPDGATLFVPDYVSGIALIDLATRKVSWLAHDPKIAVTGIDGLYFVAPETLIAIQNGTTPMRVVRLDLDAAHARITRLTVLEQNSVWLGSPTHGAVVGDEFWFIGRSGWEHMNDDGTVKIGESPRGSVLLRLPLAGA